MRIQPSTNNLDKIYFSVDTLEITGGKKLKGLRPDEDGYYDLPVAVIGAISRNETYYEPETLVTPIVDPNNIFNKMLREGNLYGEWGHPAEDAPVERMLKIDENKHSHHFRKLYTGSKLENGAIPVLAKVKPCGPYGKYLEENLLSPSINTSFSLRSIVRAKWDEKMKCQRRSILRLVTFDYVGMPGYAEASKRYSPAVEAFQNVELTPEHFMSSGGVLTACEGITDKDLLDMFGATEIRIRTTMQGIHFKGQNTFIGEEGNRRSLTHALLRR